jgi:hypothetical protein
MGKMEEEPSQERKVMLEFNKDSLPVGSRFLYRSLSGPVREDVVLEWSGSGEFIKLKVLGWLSSNDRFRIVPLEILDFDDMCPNCVTPWKCNGPHKK